MMHHLSPSEHALAQAIIKFHQDLQIPQKEDLQSLTFSSNDPIYRITKTAAWQLGFINQDAQCIALAWQQQCSSLEQLDPLAWPASPMLFGIHPNSSESFAPCPKNLGLYVVAPDASWVKKLAQAGLKTIQLRFKSSDQQQILEQVKTAIATGREYDSQLFINDYWELAIEEAAYGVHLGQEDLDTADLSRIRAAGLRLGISTHGYAEMLRAQQYAPSYIALGAIFPTTLKQMQTAPQGLGRLTYYAQLLAQYPLVGIGGVDENNITQVLDTGVGSAALVRAVINSPDYTAAINRLKKHFQ